MQFYSGANLKLFSFFSRNFQRPGLLLCEREESRTGEKMMRGIANVFDKSNRMSISTENVAKAMLINSLKDSSEKTQVLENGDLVKLTKPWV